MESTSANGGLDLFVIAYTANAIMGLIIQWSEKGFEHSPEYMNEKLSYILKTLDQG